MVGEIFDRLPFATKEEWLKIRGKGIGGSDASCIIGENPYKSNLRLWQEKTGQVESEDLDNEFIRYGISAESHIRGIFQADYVNKLLVSHHDQVLVRKDKPHLRASLDGELEVLEDFDFRSYYKQYYDKNNLGMPELITFKKGKRGVLEIKTTNVLSSMHRENWNNQIPQNYYVQVLHYLLITGYDFVILRAQLKWEDNNKIKTLETRDYGFTKEQVLEDLKYLENEIDIFWNENILKRIEPPLKVSI